MQTYYKISTQKPSQNSIELTPDFVFDCEYIITLTVCLSTDNIIKENAFEIQATDQLPFSWKSECLCVYSIIKIVLRKMKI